MVVVGQLGYSAAPTGIQSWGFCMDQKCKAAVLWAWESAPPTVTRISTSLKMEFSDNVRLPKLYERAVFDREKNFRGQLNIQHWTVAKQEIHSLPTLKQPDVIRTALGLALESFAAV